MTRREEIASAIQDAGRLESLYRQAIATKEEQIFKEEIALHATTHPNNVLLSAWVHRLDIPSKNDKIQQSEIIPEHRETKHWIFAILGSAVLGILYMLLAWDKSPVPVPGESAPTFWIGWSPITGLIIIAYLAMLDHPQRRQWYSIGAVAVGLISGPAMLFGKNQTGDLAILTTIHLPFLVWSIVGFSVVWGREKPSAQFHAFMVKSLETILTIGIYLGAGGLLTGLTAGIFEAMDIRFSEDTVRTIAAVGLGATPLLALASVCDPTRAPLDQNWTTGLARILHILTRLMLPLTLIVLIVYVCWFIPAYFWTPFQKREVLIVYNATLIAIIALLTSILPGKAESKVASQDRILYMAILTLSILALLLNAYALIAIVNRTFEFGLSQNRHAVLGWNIVTFLMFAVLTIKLWQSGSKNWQSPFCITISKVMGLAVIWTIWVVFGLPLF